MNLRKKIEEKLKEVIDPETNLDVIKMGIIKVEEVKEDGTVEVLFEPTAPFCPLGIQIATSAYKKLKEIPEIKDIKFDIKNFVYADLLKEELKKIS